MRRLVLVLALASTLAVAGCLGGGDDADTASTTDPGPQDQPDVPDDDTRNETDSGPQFAWNETEREGTVTGAYAAGLALTTSGSSQNVTVREGTRNLTLNVSSQSNEVTMRIAPPGCPGTFDDDCSTTVTTEDGEAHWNTTDPDVGNWTIDFFRASNGYGEVRYTLTIAKLVPADDTEAETSGR